MADVWDEIAEGWNNFNQKPRMHLVTHMSKHWQGKILDVGCGNGRDLFQFEGELIGIDSSREMIKFAEQKAEKMRKHARFHVGSMTDLPFQPNSFDYIICIASLHCLKREDQLVALREMYRVLKPGGKMLLTVWNKWQPRFFFGKREQTVPWKKQDRVLERYYYLHSIFSFLGVLNTTAFHIRSIHGIFGKNLSAVLQKKVHKKHDEGS